MRILFKDGGEFTGADRIMVDEKMLYVDDIFIVPIEDIYAIEEEGE